MERQGLARLAVVVVSTIAFPLAGVATGDAWHEAEAAPVRDFGWVERVRIEPGGLELKAKLDTGATTSSLHAIDPEVRELDDGSERIRFRALDRNDREVEMDLPVERWVRIKRKRAVPLRRAVVDLGICLGDRYRRVEVSLADRENYLYPVLLGRNFLAGVARVDSARTFTADPDCRELRPAPTAAR
ncbi:MAG: RimK/LysX family protein [Myxococcota bacterium]|nr:RimK/LysX family protein [Myxococcota bacterium]